MSKRKRPMPFLRTLGPGDGTTNNYPYSAEQTRKNNTERLAEWGMFMMAGVYKPCVIACNNESEKFDLVDHIHHEAIQVCISILRTYDLMECFCIYTPQHIFQAFFPRTSIVSPAETIWYEAKQAAYKRPIEKRFIKGIIDGLTAH